MGKGMCSFPGCSRPARSKGLCEPHYARQWRGQTGDLVRPRGTVWERWCRFIDKQPDGCWLWTGSVNKGGYGQIMGPGHRIHRAHRLAWYFATGEDPGTLAVLHRCDNPRCVNPEHLFLGTQLDNIADMKAKGRAHGPYKKL